MEHECTVLPPKYGTVTCPECGEVIVDDFDYSDEERDYGG